MNQYARKLNDLAAVTHPRVIPAYQPIVNIARGEIEGYEVLARYRDGAGVLRSIGDRLSGGAASDWQTLRSLDRSVRKAAVRDLSALPAGFLSINISPDWIREVEDWSTTPLLRLLDAEGIEPDRVILEITEQKAPLEKLLSAVESYRAAGFRVAIDDFGAGESQWHRIMALEPDILKLDMTLFKQGANEGRHHEILQSVSQFAEQSGCQLVCEGVETPAEVLYGLELGAVWMQGFLFSRAHAEFQPPDRFLDQVRRLQQTFLHHQIEKEQSLHQFETRVHATLRGLLTWCRTLEDWTRIQTATIPDILTFYVCDEWGNQVSPNFRITDNGILRDTVPLGTNWCWRPHFYRLLAAQRRRTRQSRGFTTSAPYRDVNTRQWCRSYVTRLDARNYLLVDVSQRANPGLPGN